MNFFECMMNTYERIKNVAELTAFIYEQSDKNHEIKCKFQDFITQTNNSIYRLSLLLDSNDKRRSIFKKNDYDLSRKN